ncbi:hypothetical protein ABLT35_12755 [Acinetobacter johnsonii]|jgi:hypothetical protein|uniref:hypothetical protein n=1 Tax=Acinetobacter johnsonii TaxID=40214 RepID=UPI002448CC41|nr:hypothetical protein [Acinetobacter johnsonii]MDH1699683.1 hypothetical protein [Acinetobacter johnsonii]
MSIKIGRILITYRFNPPKYDPHSPYCVEALGRLVVGGGYKGFLLSVHGCSFGIFLTAKDKSVYRKVG